MYWKRLCSQNCPRLKLTFKQETFSDCTELKYLLQFLTGFKNKHLFIALVAESRYE